MIDSSAAQHHPISGCGIGLRAPHVHEIITTHPDIPWLEILADNYLAEGGLILEHIQEIAQRYPIAMHCVGLSIGSAEQPDLDYCKKLKQLAENINACWISDHLCFSSLGGHYSHDLLPFPLNRQTLALCVQRIDQIQQLLGQPILLENISSYMHYAASSMSEIEFICALTDLTDCQLLVDANNLYVNHVNKGLDIDEFITHLPHHRVKEIHLAGFQPMVNFLLDAHNQPVADPVWELYARLLNYCPDTPTLIEWDNDIPTLDVLLAEAKKADSISQHPISDDIETVATASA